MASLPGQTLRVSVDECWAHSSLHGTLCCVAQHVRRQQQVLSAVSYSMSDASNRYSLLCRTACQTPATGSYEYYIYKSFFAVTFVSYHKVRN